LPHPRPYLGEEGRQRVERKKTGNLVLCFSKRGKKKHLILSKKGEKRGENGREEKDLFHEGRERTFQRLGRREKRKGDNLKKKKESNLKSACPIGKKGRGKGTFITSWEKGGKRGDVVQKA